ncbi:peptidoglycan hydrolase-like protein with peptidoglycan-binding domain [Rhizobium tibeticum]|uniref:peptidoglycan-binding domain-containing protein n=1 Tax=Rhizobium tibeticum TaxID=501024 RepID=UPI00277D6B18|nr:peptidoglycan-binding domain-containing protein [Rhizobium tibeticum]MDP9812974.1 peptidoglycan hydrolase-like protein with peptidoglycan-binding domain [Rhizobium tibeticum]
MLARGNRGDVVIALQNMLRHVGFDAVIDGKFEQRTEDAVIEFQGDQNLEPNGQVGSATWAALDEATQ